MLWITVSTDVVISITFSELIMRLANRQQLSSLRIALIVMTAFISSTGCDHLQAKKTRPGRESSDRSVRMNNLTVAEIKQAVKEIQDDLPMRVHDKIVLERLTCDYNGATVTGWFVVDDEELVRNLRRAGWEHVTDTAKERLASMEIDFDKFEGSDKFNLLLEQDELSLQYILEDKYQTHLGSWAVNRSAIDGKERVGKTQENPFLVNQVSAQGGQ